MRVQELEKLRNLDHGGCADDTDTEALGNGQLEARCIAELNIVDESLVAVISKEGDTNVADWSREVLGDGLQHRTEGGLELFHYDVV